MHVARKMKLFAQLIVVHFYLLIPYNLSSPMISAYANNRSPHFLWLNINALYILDNYDDY